MTSGAPPTRGRLAGVAWHAGPALVAVAGGLAVARMNLVDPIQIARVGLLVVSVGLAVVALDRPLIALYGTLTAAAFQQEIVLLGVKTGTVELALVAFAPALLLAARRAERPLLPVLAGVLLVAGSAVSAFSATNVALALWGAVRWALVVNLVLATTALLRAGGEREQARFTSWIVGIGVVVGVLGLLQQRGIYTFVGPPYKFQPDSSFGYYTVYANFMAVCAVLAVGVATRGLARRAAAPVLLATGAAFVTLFALVGATSRGGLLALAVGLAALVLFRVRRPGSFLGGAAVVTGGLLAVYLALPRSMVDAVLERRLDSAGSDRIRGLLQQAGRALLLAHPEGIGYLNFQAAVTGSGVTVRRALEHAHELFVQVGLDAGWLGLAGFAAWVVGGLAPAVREGLRTRGHGYPAICGAAVLGYLAQGLGDYLFYETGSMIFFAALLSCAGLRTRPAPPVPDASGRRATVAAAP